MSEIKAWGYVKPETKYYVDETGFIIAPINKIETLGFNTPIYTQEQLDTAIQERDILIRDLRKELNERRYGRSANQ